MFLAWVTGAITVILQGQGRSDTLDSKDAILECIETETESTHLDVIPVIFVFLEHSGCVEWGLGDHHGLLEGIESPRITA